MGITYGFDLSCYPQSNEEGARIRAALVEHTALWSEDEIKCDWRSHDTGWWLRAYAETQRSGDFDTPESELAAAVRLVWRTAGRYVECDAHVLFVEETPMETVVLDEDDYEVFLRDEGADAAAGAS